MGHWSTYLTVQNDVKRFVSVVHNPCNLSRSTFSHWEFFIAIVIIDNNWIQLGSKRRKYPEGFRQWFWFRILKWRGWRGGWDWWGKLSLVMIRIWWVLSQVLTKLFAGFFFNQLVEYYCGFGLLDLCFLFHVSYCWMEMVKGHESMKGHLSIN